MTSLIRSIGHFLIPQKPKENKTECHRRLTKAPESNIWLDLRKYTDGFNY